MWPQPDHENIIKESFVKHQGADTIHWVALCSDHDLFVNEGHEDVGDVWRGPGPHGGAHQLLETLRIWLFWQSYYLDHS